MMDLVQPEKLPQWITGIPDPIYPEIPQLQPKLLDITLIDELTPFLDPYRYKIAYGGRGSSKSWGIARMLIARAYAKREKILCCRELQGSIEESVHALLEDQISRMGLTSAFEIQAKKITCLTTGSVFLFEGIHHNVTKIKSMEGVTLVWAEEAEKISKTSWDTLTPTIRAEDSEIWISFNPDDDLDETWLRFVEDPPPRTYSVSINFHQNPWFPEVLREEMMTCKRKSYDDYEHIWLGKPRRAMKGAYYSELMSDVWAEGRALNLPYDDTMPVITSWDLGWADSTVIWFAQVSLSEIRIINCIEFKGTSLPGMVKTLKELPYQYSQHILPHDVAIHELGSGKSRKEVLSGLGIQATIAPKSVSVIDGIYAVKSFLPRCYFDKTKCEYGLKALKRYRTKYNEDRKVFDNKPFHDWTSDFADAFRYLAITPHETGFSKWGSAIDYGTGSKHI